MLGLRKPIGPLPALIRSSLMRLMTAAKMGVLAEVPPDSVKLPPLYTFTINEVRLQLI